MADLWFEAHQTICKHPKTLKLARLLTIKRREAVGLLVDLFSWGIDIAGKYGELPGLVAEDIAAALDYPPKSAEKVVAALVKSGYMELIDGLYSIHDWYDYAGKLYDSRERNREKTQRYRDGKKAASYLINNSDSDGHVTVTSPKRDRATVPNLTVPNLTVPNLTEPITLSVLSNNESGRKETEESPSFLPDKAKDGKTIDWEHLIKVYEANGWDLPEPARIWKRDHGLE